MTVVSVAYIRGLTLNRSRTYARCCAAGRVHVVRPWEKDYAQGLQLDAMVQLNDAGSDIVCCRF
jgi:hypothetical protein